MDFRRPYFILLLNFVQFSNEFLFLEHLSGELPIEVIILVLALVEAQVQMLLLHKNGLVLQLYLLVLFPDLLVDFQNFIQFLPVPLLLFGLVIGHFANEPI